ncbi:DEAD/DEAH box helicase family protein [Saccharomonospora saliphila]|uniref:hypothetical protein n=1 Tax=Saccharomonospora saliphila TaxID=369829 RepID=UPI00039A46DF|nr:hypothetical protein [Saccharomonospora saliphila]
MRAALAGRDPVAWGAGALSLLLGVVFVVVDLAYNQGHLIAPIDDAYIHLQYGTQLGSGHPFEYNTGDPISTGASSLLYAFVLGAAHAVGFGGHWLLWFAVVFGVVCVALAAGLTVRLGTLLVGRAVGAWAGVLTAVSGPLLWGAVSGMEVGLTAALVVGAVLAFVRERASGRFVVTPLVGVALALVRPEGLVFALMLCGAMAWTLIAGRRARGRAGEHTGGRARWVSLSMLPLAAGVAQYVFYALATGTVRANGVQSKSHLYDQPVFYLGEFVDRTVANVRGVLDRFGGLNDTDFAFPGALVLCVAGLAYLFATRPRWRVLVTAVALGFGAVVASASTLSTALIHELRYFQPFVPLFLLFAVCGVYGVTRLVPRPRPRRYALHAALLVALLLTTVATPTWAVRLGRQAATIRDTDVSVAAWIDRNLPRDAIVAVKDVGAIAYFGHRRVIDTVGLATNGLAEASNNGPGSLYEALRGLPPEQRPTHFAVYEPPPGASMRPFADAGLFGQRPLEVFPVRAPASLDGRRIVPFSDMRVHRADWSLAGSGERAPVPGEVRDYLNTGDLDSEQRHDYAVRMQQEGLQPHTTLRRHDDVIDSGRIVVGGESFTAHDLVPGRETTLATRVLAPGSNHEVRVRVDGRDAGVWTLPPGADRWSTARFTIPGDLVTSANPTIELEPVRPLLSPYPEYTSFGYWLLQ